MSLVVFLNETILASPLFDNIDSSINVERNNYLLMFNSAFFLHFHGGLLYALLTMML